MTPSLQTQERGHARDGLNTSPFSVHLLRPKLSETIREADTSQCRSPQQEVDELAAQNMQLLALMPSSYLSESGDLIPASFALSYLQKEFDLQRLNNVLELLWLVGLPVPPRALHHQLLLNRDIFITERMDMHLVWTTGHIFIKPLSRFLLEPRFWTTYLSCSQNCLCSQGTHAGLQEVPIECEHKRLHRCALGFLFSYAALIRHESDFFIAKEKHLIPAELEWSTWRIFVEQLDTERIYPSIDPRFWYGELRLSRLNKIYFLSQRPFLRSYMSHWQRYGGFFRDNFAWLASATVYLAIVLTALQVGLATKSLADNKSFQSVSYGFTVFSILAPLAAMGLIVLVFFYMFVRNWTRSMRFKKTRFSAIGIVDKGS